MNKTPSSITNLLHDYRLKAYIILELFTSPKFLSNKNAPTTVVRYKETKC